MRKINLPTMFYFGFRLSQWVHHLCSTLCDPMHHSPPGSSVHGIFQARMLEWVAISFSGGIFLTQGSNLCLLRLPHWQADSLQLSHQESLMYFMAV